MDGQDDRLARLLASLNRKERHWLLAGVLGNDRPPLSETFVAALGAALEGSGCPPVPRTAWWSIDYHLDWIAAALALLRRADDGGGKVGYGKVKNADAGYGMTACGKPVQLLRGNQEDADLLICFERRLIVVEAKAGTGWSREQMDGKVKRLWDIKKLGAPFGVEVHLVLTSPRSTNVHLGSPDCCVRKSWKEFLGPEGRPFHMPMTFGGAEGLYQARRTGRGTSGRYDQVEFVELRAPDAPGQTPG